jgi:hypothetical protein
VSSFHWDWGFAWSIVPELLNGIVVTIVATFLGSVATVGDKFSNSMLRIYYSRWGVIMKSLGQRLAGGAQQGSSYDALTSPARLARSA